MTYVKQRYLKMAFRPVFERVVNTLGLIQELATVEIANRPSEMFLKHFFLRGTQEEETRLWDLYLCCANMTKGTKLLYLSAALYFSAKVVLVTNPMLVADPWITFKLCDGVVDLCNPRFPKVRPCSPLLEQTITHPAAS